MTKNLLLTTALLVSNVALADLKVNKEASNVQWDVQKVLASGHHGTIGIKSAELKGQKDSLSTAKIVLDISNLNVEDLSGEWKDKFLGHIKSADFFDVERYPEAILNITSIKDSKALGTLTIKNKTNPIEIPFTLTDKEYQGVVVFDRTKYDMVYGSNNFFKNLGDKAISNDVKVSFKLVLE